MIRIERMATTPALLQTAQLTGPTEIARAVRRPLRSGVAAFEFVLALPLFIVLFAGLLHVASATLFRIKAIEIARLQTWKEAADTVPQQPLNPAAPVLDGAASGTAAIPFAWGRTWRGSRGTAESRTMVLSGTWDYVSLPFDETADYRMDLYPAHLILSQTGVPADGADLPGAFARHMRALQQIVAR